MGELEDIGNTFNSKDPFKKREMFIHLGFFFFFQRSSWQGFSLSKSEGDAEIKRECITRSILGTPV